MCTKLNLTYVCKYIINYCNINMLNRLQRCVGANKLASTNYSEPTCILNVPIGTLTSLIIVKSVWAVEYNKIARRND